MKNKIIILGATGFIGKAITLLLLSKGVNVELYSKKGGNVNGYPVRALDISKRGRLWQQLKDKKVSAVIYLSSKIPKYFQEADWNLFSYNLKMHKQVFECWQRLNCHLIYASSCSVYGHPSFLPWREENSVSPDNFYSTSKLMGEVLFCQKAQKRNLALTILRINGPYGVKMRNKTVINIFIEQALKNRDITLLGSGKREQDFIYILDVAEAFWLACKNKKCGIYNIAAGKTITMKRLAKLIIKLTNSSTKIVYSGSLDLQEDLKVAIDISKAQKKLNFSPAYSLEDGLNESIQQYKQSGCYENRHFGRYSR